MKEVNTPSINTKIDINVDEIMLENKIIQIDQFYSSLSWLNHKEIFINRRINDNEEILNICKDFRIPLLNSVSQLIPTAFYPTDTGWIRKTQFKTNEQPLSTQIHMDSPYIVISVCLSNHETNENHDGTEFVYHRELGFKKVTQLKESPIFYKFYTRQRHQIDYWKVWKKLKLKCNRAYIYSGSLLHRMPFIGPELGSRQRMMQFFIFRLDSQKLKEFNFAI